MDRFARLLTDLIYTRARNGKLALLADYLRDVPDPDRGWALAGLTGEIDFPAIKAGIVRALIQERVDPVLFALSRDFVGDTAETVSLMWPAPTGPVRGAPGVSEAVALLASASRGTAKAVLAGLLDRLDEDGRFALLKLATGALRIGVSARLAKTAFAQAFGVALDEVEELWHAMRPPYAELFAWATGAAPKPDISMVPVFRPFMLANPLEDEVIDLKEYAAEWKWDGIRIQIVSAGGATRLFSRGGEDITESFPDVAEAFDHEGVLDGELLVRGTHQGGGAASFNALQQRLGRKTVPGSLLTAYPAFVRLYDILLDGADDLRRLPWSARRARLEGIAQRLDRSAFDISALIEAETFEALAELRAQARETDIEGVMLKRRDSAYEPGRKAGLWFKWKREPLTADCVLMYAQRGSGKRSSLYSDYTFGCWTAPEAEGGVLLPVGKAYSGFSDEELKWLDSFVRKQTTGRFGPVREVEKSLVLEVAFDAVNPSTRHKSGIAMRFPRISRIRRDKPANEADLIETLRRMTAAGAKAGDASKPQPN
ncbi:cisplatin damage response ATP-dependent DNA ligase [Hyphomonas sp.]|uniref:cisplatin damage response ATP-dependent DNA ligase n=1 Tax=Hyphomonas sp. TaxID=87 RepID=UPI003340E134